MGKTDMNLFDLGLFVRAVERHIEDKTSVVEIKMNENAAAKRLCEANLLEYHTKSKVRLTRRGMERARSDLIHALRYGVIG